MKKRIQIIFTGGTIAGNVAQHKDSLNLKSDPDSFMGVIERASEIVSKTLFENSSPAQYIRGHLLLISGLDVPTDESGNVYSYNYTPNKDTYSTKAGVSNDVYFYPRSDAWIIGGSRQVGALNEAAKWHGDDSLQPLININGIPVPQPILDVNRDILAGLTGLDITEYPMRAIIGYRYATTPLRIESVQEYGRPVIHNYGHGGAGVTTSWGCSLRILNMIQKLKPLNTLGGGSKTTESSLVNRLRQTMTEQMS